MCQDTLGKFPPEATIQNPGKEKSSLDAGPKRWLGTLAGSSKEVLLLTERSWSAKVGANTY
jgi:hypothetical protein